jgi:hypothetical protein
MGELAGRKPDAAFSIRERDIKNQETLPSSLAEFLSSIKLRHAA